MAIWWFWPQIKPWIKQALGNVVTQKAAAPVKFPSSMKPAVAPWVVWWLWNVVTPKQVTTLKTDIEKKKQQDVVKQQEQVAAQSAQLAKSANTFKDLYYDVAKWTDEQILKAYPELWGDATIIKKIRQNPQIAVDLYYDLQKPWVTQEKISQAYPELYWADNAKWWVLNYLMWMGKQSVSTFGTNLVSWALDLVWADKAREKVQGFQEFVKWEEEASLRRQWYNPDSWAFKAWETTSNFALSTVPTLPYWWAWLWFVKTIANPVVRTLAWGGLGVLEWLATTNLGVAWSEWRKANATENTIGGVLGGLFWALAAKGPTLEQKLWNEIQPKLSPTELVAARKAGNVSKSFGTTKLNPTQYDKEVIKTAKDIGIKAGGNVDDNIAKADWYIEQKATSLGNYLKNSKIFNYNQVTSKIDNIAQPGDIVGDKAAIYNNLKKTAKDIIKKNKGNLGWLLKARQEFDRVVRENFPSVFDGSEKSLNKLVASIRDEMNDYIIQNAGSDIVKNSLQQQSNAYRIIDNLADKWEKIGMGVLQRVAKKYPKSYELWKLTTAAGLWGLWINKFIWWD